MCNNCIHKIVCSKYIATGGVKKCEHHREERKGRWIIHNKGQNNWCECSVCNTVGSPFWKVCPVCTADMRGTEDGKKERT